MELRYRKINNDEMPTKVSDLENLVKTLQNQLLMSISREKKLLEKFGVDKDKDPFIGLDMLEMGTYIDIDNSKISYEDVSSYNIFIRNLCDRGGWLIGLLMFQSCSSFILSNNNKLLNKHPSIIYFLTMLVGAGGNAGNQAAVRVIRDLALNTLNIKNMKNLLKFLYKELIMAVSLSGLIGIIGLARTMLSNETTTSEALAITLSLVIIVFVSIIVGAILPIILNFIKLDPAHASTSIQVIMDISGVLLTCVVASAILDNIPINDIT